MVSATSVLEECNETNESEQKIEHLLDATCIAQVSIITVVSATFDPGDTAKPVR
jgi:hypothetical protein